MAQFKGNIILQGKIKTLTGLHIGGSKDSMEIGGIDLPVIRDPHTGYPYIPGSSIKGKMRMLLEFAEGCVTNGNPCSCKESPEICRIFGTADKDEAIGPTRLIVRDAYPTDETVKIWKNLDSDLLFTEYKGENTIDRLTSQANPRFVERVVSGSEFEFEMVYSIYDIDENDDLSHLGLVFKAMRLLQDSTLGGHGSRGYGKIGFTIDELMPVSVGNYKTGEREKSVLQNKGMTLEDLKEEEVIKNLRSQIEK